MHILNIKTKSGRDVVDITDKVNDLIGRTSKHEKICHLFIRHTTAALTTVYVDPKRELDLIGIMESVVPHYKTFHKGESDHTHITTHLPPDILASFVGSALAIPIKDGKLMLGNFQRVVVIEFSGPGRREVVVVAE
jgi:secondary thiamine-phosphate synthase enzyme